MAKYLLQLYTALLLSVAYVTAEVTVEKGGYSVLVSFAQNVAFENGKALLDNLQENLQKASEVLHGAIGLQFSKVAIQIPYSWDTSEWENVTVLESYKYYGEKADILIDYINDTVFGKFPFAGQYGGCETPGHQIVIPAVFLEEGNQYPKGISLAREWLKYRYGVFDENGYFEDPLYPLFYTIPGGDQNEVQITDCTDVKLTYNFMESNGSSCSTDEKTLSERLKNGGCTIQVDEESLTNITSSFMYYEEHVSDMQHICDKEKHNNRSPNKQNALCYEKSILDTINNSPDLKNTEKNEAHIDIEYVYLQEPKPKVVIAWENTNNMVEKGKMVRNAITKFLFDLPYGSKISAFPFTSTGPPNKKYTLKKLDKEVRNELVREISSEFKRVENGNVNLAIGEAIKILQSDGADELEGDIIIITGSVAYSFDSNIIKNVEGLKKLCVKFLYLGNGTLPEEMTNYASNFPCATVNGFSKSDKDETLFEELNENMGQVLPLTIDDKATATVKTEYLEGNSAILYEADDFVETVTFWIYDEKDYDDFHLTLNGEEVTDGKEEERYTKFAIVSYSITQAGTVGLVYQLDLDQPIFVQVTATSKAGKYISGKVIVHNPSQKGSEVQMPVIIYAIVRFGPYPLQKANVTATIEDPLKNITKLTLYDDGKGDPDITRNDGVYSRYFIAFSEKGDYTVTIHVNNDENHTTYGADENIGYQTCCGSSVTEGTSTELANFSRTYHGTFTAVSGRPTEGYKPSRITDLKIDEFTDDKIILKWSAPGGEADTGTVKTYEIKYFNSQEDGMKNFESGKELSYTETPKERGNIETFEISFKEFEKSGQYYIALKAKNAENQTSGLSNAVEVFISADKISDEKDKETKDEKIKAGSTNNRTIAIVIGVIVGVVALAIIIYLLIYFVIVKPKIKREKQKKENQSNGSGRKVEHTSLNPINSISADTLMRHHNEKTKAKMENKEPPILKEEDFESKNAIQENETKAQNNNQQQDISNKTSRDGQSMMPPKSPKRATPV